jgi:hypothetical protein
LFFGCIGGCDIVPPVNGRLCHCKERATAKNRLFPNESMRPAAQLLLSSGGAAQILRAGGS